MSTSVRRYDTTALGLLKEEEEEEEEEGKIAIFYFARCVRKIALYSDLIFIFFGGGKKFYKQSAT